MKIVFVGKFQRIYDEEYIARSFEMLGHEVIRISDTASWIDQDQTLLRHKPDIILYCKWNWRPELDKTIGLLRKTGTKLVCWVFDLYFGYSREWLVRNSKMFRGDLVISTDDGHRVQWINYGIKHHCVRQGIYKEHCKLYPIEKIEHDVIFVGSDNPYFPERKEQLRQLDEQFKFKWFGKKSTNDLRGLELNEEYARTKIVVGDSFYSPQYWSNRVVETLGRGGFLIHQEVEGLKEEYPDLVTYKRGDTKDLIEKIKYYLQHEDERREIIRKNFELVQSRYTMDKKCRDVIDIINETSK